MIETLVASVREAESRYLAVSKQAEDAEVESHRLRSESYAARDALKKAQGDLLRAVCPLTVPYDFRDVFSEVPAR